MKEAVSTTKLAVGGPISPRSFLKRFRRQILPVQCPMKKLNTGSDQEKLANVLQSSENPFYGRFKLRCLVFWLKQLVVG